MDEDDGVPAPLTAPVVLLDAPPDTLPRLDLLMVLGAAIVELGMLLVVAAVELVVGP